MVEYLCKTNDVAMRAKLLAWVTNNPWLFIHLGDPRNQELQLHLEHLVPPQLTLGGEALQWCCDLISRVTTAATAAVHSYKVKSEEEGWGVGRVRNGGNGIARVKHTSTLRDSFPMVTNWGATNISYPQTARKSTGRHCSVRRRLG